MAKKIFEKSSNYLYFVFRILIGLLFLLHGTSKLPNLISGEIQLISLMGLAGIIELIAGVFIIIGLLTRYTAVITAIEMLVAYLMVHLPKGINPLKNNGEPALLFFSAFLVLIAFGARKWALDNLIKK